MMLTLARTSALKSFNKPLLSCLIAAVAAMVTQESFAQPAPKPLPQVGQIRPQHPAPVAAPMNASRMAGQHDAASAGYPPLASPAALGLNTTNAAQRDPFRPPQALPTPTAAESVPGMNLPAPAPVVQQAPKVNMECLDPNVKTQGRYIGKFQGKYVFKSGTKYCFDKEPPNFESTPDGAMTPISPPASPVPPPLPSASPAVTPKK